MGPFSRPFHAELGDVSLLGIQFDEGAQVIIVLIRSRRFTTWNPFRRGLVGGAYLCRLHAGHADLDGFGLILLLGTSSPAGKRES